MTIEKFRIDLSQVPAELLRDDAGDDVLVIKVPVSIGGPKVKLILRDQEVIRTENDFIKEILRGYAPPRIPVQHKAHGAEDFEHCVYDHTPHAAKRPFAAVASNTTHQHVVD